MRSFYGSRLEQLLAFVRIRLGNGGNVIKLLLWLVLLFFCWPLALAALVLYPLVWLLLLPFRIVGIAVEGALELVWAVVTLPARLLRAL
jgi:hypothetical protein